VARDLMILFERFNGGAKPEPRSGDRLELLVGRL